MYRQLAKQLVSSQFVAKKADPSCDTTDDEIAKWKDGSTTFVIQPEGQESPLPFFCLTYLLQGQETAKKMQYDLKPL